MECAALAKFGYKPLIYGLLVSRVHVCIVDRPRPLCLNFGSTACCVTEKKKKFLKQNSSSEFSLLLRRCTFMKQKDVVGTNSVTQKQFPETKGIWKHRRDRCYWLCSQNDPCKACLKNGTFACEGSKTSPMWPTNLNTLMSNNFWMQGKLFWLLGKPVSL